MTGTDSRQLILDAHVHLYDCFDLALLLDSTRAKARQLITEFSLTSNNTEVCLLCVDLQDRSFDVALQNLSAVHGYVVEALSDTEPFSRTIRHVDTDEAFQIVWGHQVITSENLEVLVFGLAEPILNGLTLDHVVETVRQNAWFGILPWGVGKWTGSRGKHIASALAQSEPAGAEGRLWVGDNGGRLRLSSLPRLIRQSVERGRWNVPGSDPLPFAEQCNKPLSRGVLLSGPYDSQQPLESVSKLLAKTTQQPVEFGHGETVMRFFRSQLGMQLRKRLARHY